MLIEKNGRRPHVRCHVCCRSEITADGATLLVGPLSRFVRQPDSPLCMEDNPWG